MERENTYEKMCPYVERAKNGDKQAFEYLYHSTYESTRNFVSNFCKDQNDVEDILQEVYLEVYHSLPILKNSMAFFAWQRRITYHCCLKSVRKQKPDIIGDEKIEFVKSLMEDSVQPQDVVLQNEKARILNECIRKLPEKQRAAMILNVIQQLKMREAAEILDCNVNAVKNLLYHGKKNLKKQIEALPKEDREALGLRSFGFFSLYPVLRSSMAEMGKAGSRKNILLAKKVMAGVLTACGAGAAGFLLLNRETLPSHSFQSVQTPNIMFETSDLKGIRIPKPEPKPVQKSTGPSVSLKHVGEDRVSGRIVIRAGGDIDYHNTYLQGENGKRVSAAGYDSEKKILYFPPQKNAFILHLVGTDGKQRLFRYRKVLK
ncbi:RNA polymerase sigma factor [Anaerostipes sp.]|uniref:RNA polymerase sigma factor n=1 Tax=Anaerostipes sp. TaxID=1872530 RepID=UPI0025C62A1E|nr:RNA polymerase sigma factor [Anaerostipes sp.]MBS7008332.1 RNA polymerase sigma factor [Anaerostipes sp.]